MNELLPCSVGVVLVNEANLPPIPPTTVVVVAVDAADACRVAPVGVEFRCEDGPAAEMSAVCWAEFAALDSTLADVRRDENGGGTAPEPVANEYEAAEPGSTGGGACEYACEDDEECDACVCTEKRCEARGVVAILNSAQLR